MYRRELARRVAGERGLGTAEAGAAVKAPARGEAVRIPGFGVTLDASRRDPASDPGSGSGAGSPGQGMTPRAAIRF